MTIVRTGRGGMAVEIRPAARADLGAVRALHAGTAPGRPSLRFGTPAGQSAAQQAQRACRPAGQDHAALLAWQDGRLIGLASYEPASAAGAAAVTLAVSRGAHGRAVAALLLERLARLARLRGLTALTATSPAGDPAMLRVLAGAGLPARRQVCGGAVEWTVPLPGADPGPEVPRNAPAGRERPAGAASLRPLLAPESVAVIGASRRPGTIGRAILRNLVRGGFAGRVYAVNPRARQLEGMPCAASVTGLPEPPDLAVIAVPAAAVPAVAADCGRLGVRALVVISSGLDAEGADLLATCRRHGMRLVGPDCLGVMVPGTGLNATFAASPAAAGAAGLAVQSGGAGIALLEHLSRLGIGVSSFASLGGTYDVSASDLLRWWEQDEQTRLAVVHAESLGSPRAFARAARRAGRDLPVLTVLSARPPGGPARAGAPLISREALLGQAGIIAARGLGELTEAAALLASQPLPEGSRVAVVSNAGGAGALAAAACTAHGLQAARTGAATRRRLRALLPAGAAVAGPVDTTAAVSSGTFRACLEQVAADDGVDAVLAVTVPTAIADLRGAVAAATVSKPLAAALLEQAESVRLLPRPPGGPGAGPGSGSADASPEPASPEPASPEPAGPGAGAAPAVRAVPAFACAESAARALGHAARYRAWRDRQDASPPELTGLRPGDARDLVAAFQAASPGGGWLPSGQAASLLACYGIPLAPARPGSGTEVLAGVLQEADFGPLVVLEHAGASTADPGTADPGTGEPATAGTGGHAARLVPLTASDADELARGLPGEAAGQAALSGLLLRVSRLAGDLPEVAELDLSPVIAGPDGARAAGARIRVAPAEHRDPFRRRLR